MTPIVDLTKEPEQIVLDLVAKYLNYCNSFNAYEERKLAYKCTHAALTAMLQVCPMQLTSISGDYNNPTYTKLTKCLEIVNKELK